MSIGSRAAARLIRASRLLDRAYGKFDRARALLVTALASDEALARYNDLAYGGEKSYDATANEFRQELFNWERDAIRRVFPQVPARVLVGGAGGGREAFQLARLGYKVTAFESSPTLARSMHSTATTVPSVDAYRGRYETLPHVWRIDSGDAVDLSAGPRFGASLLGWSSFSHIRHSSVRTEVMRAFAALTDGPVVVSFFIRRPRRRPMGKLRRVLETLGRRVEGDEFTTHIGYYHLSLPEELAAEAQAAGLILVDSSYDDSDGHWPWIAVARPEVATILTLADSQPAATLPTRAS